jgi:hypothetical protein
MIQTDATSRDGLWVLLKLEQMKAPVLEAGLAEDYEGYRISTNAGWRLTVRSDDKIDPTRLISVFRGEIEKATGAFPAAMQPFYVYGVVVFEWREKKAFEEGSLIADLKALVLGTDLKRSKSDGQ